MVAKLQQNPEMTPTACVDFIRAYGSGAAYRSIWADLSSEDRLWIAEKPETVLSPLGTSPVHLYKHIIGTWREPALLLFVAKLPKDVPDVLFVQQTFDTIDRRKLWGVLRAVLAAGILPMMWGGGIRRASDEFVAICVEHGAKKTSSDPWTTSLGSSIIGSGRKEWMPFLRRLNYDYVAAIFQSGNMAWIEHLTEADLATVSRTEMLDEIFDNAVLAGVSQRSYTQLRWFVRREPWKTRCVEQFEALARRNDYGDFVKLTLHMLPFERFKAMLPIIKRARVDELPDGTPRQIHEQLCASYHADAHSMYALMRMLSRWEAPHTSSFVTICQGLNDARILQMIAWRIIGLPYGAFSYDPLLLEPSFLAALNANIAAK